MTAQLPEEIAANTGRIVASATALEFDPSAPPIFFEGFSDGSGYKATMIPHGGRRAPFVAASLKAAAAADGVVRSPMDVVLDGPAILNFSINVAPSAVNSICNYAGRPLKEHKYVLLHQANRIINDTIRRKLGLGSETVPESLFDFGNTSSASIPVTAVHRTREAFSQPGTHWIMCGFGIGLSWATISMTTARDVYCSPILEV